MYPVRNILFITGGIDLIVMITVLQK
jgi:hypothetical protein